MARRGNLFILAAPSGAGKSSLISALLQDEPADMQVSVSHTTRLPRPGEEDGVHYHFITVEQFKDQINQGHFFEYAEVFGNFYGTSKVTIEQTLQNGIDVFLDIDWQGARQVKAQIPDALGVFILPPSRQELERRLNSRGQDSAEVIADRMAEAVAEMSHYDEFDYLIVNDNFDDSLAQLQAIVKTQRNRLSRQAEAHSVMLAGLLSQ
ncbi:guanylate kinase [Ferrimonas lipolytica]|uniref:Guanylate kinase n=1 Tax=Ferrimonas lipolytica TaxID=2724191 RepID=A0A6H1UJD1_9GAMM|nr:guanylate kinase [Ferrimonas lipolytica]QIZ78326.1 guanylate kinase [Ferrimonas lipolytica]